MAEDARYEAHNALLRAITDEVANESGRYSLTDLAQAYNLVVSAYPPQS